MCQFITVKELPALGYLYNNVCNDVTCAEMPVAQIHVLINSLFPARTEFWHSFTVAPPINFLV